LSRANVHVEIPGSGHTLPHEALGNGRKARALTYLLVCIDNKATLPGIPSMPALIYNESSAPPLLSRSRRFAPKNKCAPPFRQTELDMLPANKRSTDASAFEAGE
jgi:hypothetical protein